jgi:hypothetical protein
LRRWIVETAIYGLAALKIAYTAPAFSEAPTFERMEPSINYSPEVWKRAVRRALNHSALAVIGALSIQCW